MVLWAKVCDLKEDLSWFVCGLYVGILTSSLRGVVVLMGSGPPNRGSCPIGVDVPRG